ncbi:MAG: hypothetical protein RMJ82_01530 [Gemmatales bacterium]|nr:hypothetical protein [Gemmatales bacterium]
MMGPPKRLFVAVSTGQNIANLPPILEFAGQGDLVLWLESPTASSQRWTEPAMTILKRFGIQSLPPVLLPPQIDVSSWKESLASHLAHCSARKLHPVLVLNGGHKLMAVALVELWRGFRPTLLYGYDRPAALGRSDDLINLHFEVAPYRAHRLDLPDILSASGYVIHSAPRYGRVYAATPSPDALPLPKTCYDLDTAPNSSDKRNSQPPPAPRWVPLTSRVSDTELQSAISQLPAEIRQWEKSVIPFMMVNSSPSEQMYENLYQATVKVLRSIPAFPAMDFANFKDLASGMVSPSELQQWKRQIDQLLCPKKPGNIEGKSVRTTQQRKRQIDELLCLRKGHNQRIQELLAPRRCKVFRQVCSLVRVLDNCPPKADMSLHVRSEDRPLGEQFELAVAKRVVHLASQPPHDQVVQSVWVGVKVGREVNPCEVAAELDVLLVLKNGILIHVECKTGTWERKDIDARIANLKRLGSLSARLAVCTPMFTHAPKHLDDNLQRMHENRMRLEKTPDIHYIPYTLPNQPRRYIARNSSSEDVYEVGTFEEAFAELLKEYVLR